MTDTETPNLRCFVAKKSQKIYALSWTIFFQKLVLTDRKYFVEACTLPSCTLPPCTLHLPPTRRRTASSCRRAWCTSPPTSSPGSPSDSPRNQVSYNCFFGSFSSLFPFLHLPLPSPPPSFTPPSPQAPLAGCTVMRRATGCGPATRRATPTTRPSRRRRAASRWESGAWVRPPFLHKTSTFKHCSQSRICFC